MYCYILNHHAYNFGGAYCNLIMQILKIFIKIVDKRVNNLTLKNKQATIYSLFHASLAKRKKNLFNITLL